MTKVINLFGGPGCGKSTLAAELFVKLKRDGKNVELVREYVKDWAWQNRKVGIYDQLHITGKQASKEVGLYGKVDVIVTDSPLLLSPFYHEYYSNRPSYVLPAVVGLMEQAQNNGVTYHNFVLSREKAYNQAGRYETEGEAIAIDEAIRDFLHTESIPFTWIVAADTIKAHLILNEIGE